MQKIVLKAEIDCAKCKREAFEAIAGIEGVHSVTIDIEEKKVTVIGHADPARLTMELRRLGRRAEIVSVGSAAPPPPAKDDKKENTTKNVTVKKEDVIDKEDSKVEPKKMAEPYERNIYLWPTPTGTHNMPGNWIHYDEYALSEENPNACSIC